MGRFYSDSSNVGDERHAVMVDLPGVSELSFVQALVAPSGVFGDPREVVRHPWFTHQEKRLVLSSWVRDEIAHERVVQEAGAEPPVDGVIQALARFDALAAGEYLSAVKTVRAYRARPSTHRSRPSDQDDRPYAPARERTHAVVERRTR